MKVSDLFLDPFETLCAPEEDMIISGAYTSDLLSDVMAHAPGDSALITIQSHKNTVAVASLVGAVAVILCNSRPVPEDMIEAARQEDIALLRTPENQFQTSCRLQALLQN